MIGAWLAHRTDDPLASLQGWFGLGMIVFALDDGLMLHEEVFPNSLSMPEEAALAAYSLWAGVMVVRFGRQIIARTDFGLLGSALLLLAIQGALDLGVRIAPLSSDAAEDPLKIAALILLLLYGCKTLVVTVASSPLATGRFVARNQPDERP